MTNQRQVTTIIGRLGKDPILYYRNTKRGAADVAKFSLAVEYFDAVQTSLPGVSSTDGPF